MYMFRLGTKRLNQLCKLSFHERSFVTPQALITFSNNLHCFKAELRQSNRKVTLFPQSPGVQSQYPCYLAMNEKHFSTPAENKDSSDPPKLSNKEKLKRAVKEYGATVFIFHITISLMSLGTSYLIISSGVDVPSLLDRLGLSGRSELAAGASTFVVAYAVHKVFAPIRLSITLGASPLIVRYLRRVGFLKPPKSSGS